MITKEDHHKHPPLKKPAMGKYCRCEWAVYGTHCAAINAFFHRISETLPSFNLMYVDADHGSAPSVTHLQVGKKRFTMDKEMYWNDYDDQFLFLNCDGAIVNGNHFPAQRQIVILNQEKKESLLRRVEQLTCVDMVLVTGEEKDPYDFLKEKLNPSTIVYHLEDIQSIAQHLWQSIMQSAPPLKALVLAGGKSTRMGEDKSLINYFGKPQQVHVADLCRQLSLDTYISKAADFMHPEINGFPVIRDRIVNMGPFGAILSAMIYDPDAAWLILACDLPFIDRKALEELIAKRVPSKIATAVKVVGKDFPEPLITIYEPLAYRRFLKFLSLGYACPRKVLINSDIEMIEWYDEHTITNVNTPEEKSQALSKLK